MPALSNKVSNFQIDSMDGHLQPNDWYSEGLDDLLARFLQR